jgi:acyl-CoA oxidase
VVQRKRRLLRELRPDAISLVDSWAFTDYELNSAIGREDGDVYTALLEAAKASPLNRTDEGPAWEAVLKPAMQELRRMRSKL